MLLAPSSQSDDQSGTASLRTSSSRSCYETKGTLYSILREKLSYVSICLKQRTNFYINLYIYFVQHVIRWQKRYFNVSWDRMKFQRFGLLYTQIAFASVQYNMLLLLVKDNHYVACNLHFCLKLYIVPIERFFKFKFIYHLHKVLF